MCVGIPGYAGGYVGLCMYDVIVYDVIMMPI